MSETKTKICAHCLEHNAVEGQPICEACALLPRCEICEVFFDGLVRPSQEDPHRCDGCLDFELLIKFKCFLCERPIPIYIKKGSKILHYIVRGNACDHCNGEAFRQSKISKKEEHTHQFVGYLAIVKQMYDGGTITQSQWEQAVRLNPQDVIYWSGIEELNIADESDLAVIEIEPTEVQLNEIEHE